MKSKFLILALLPFLSACASCPPQESNIDLVPPCAKVGPAGAKELRQICDEEKCKALTDFFNRHAKVCDILEARRKAGK